MRIPVYKVMYRARETKLTEVKIGYVSVSFISDDFSIISALIYLVLQDEATPQNLV